MTKVSVFFSSLIMMVVIASSGCELVTKESDPHIFNPASHLIINEVSALPLSHQNYYGWIEFFNPTLDTIDVTNWTLSMHTQRFQMEIIAQITVDTLLNFTLVSTRITVTPDSAGVIDVPFGEGLFAQPGFEPVRTRILPGRLLTITNNEARMEDHTRWGPDEQGIQRERGAFQGAIFRVDTLAHGRDTVNQIDSLTFRVLARQYGFLIQPEDQLVLKDPTGKVVDVVRIGNYTPYDPHPFTDPNGLLGSQNRAIPAPPEFKSVSRFAEAYFTGNTANDFFITDNIRPPIPGAYSQLRKQ